MDSWLIYTALTLAYIVILIVYFMRRSRSHEAELRNFLAAAQNQLETHKREVANDANRKVIKAMAIIKKVHDTASSFEKQAQREYDQIIQDAKTERQEILTKTKAEIETLFKQADVEIEEYKASRFKEIEKNLVKLVIAVTHKVIGKTLSETDHKNIIYASLEEIIQKKSHADWLWPILLQA